MKPSSEPRGDWPLPISPQAFDQEILEHKLRTGISKYDLIKVKILSGTGDSYSMLSRLIIYKMLTCIGVISKLQG